jgi:flagellar hook-length control protein FliK
MQAAQEAAQTIREQQVQHSEDVGARLVGQSSERLVPVGVQMQLLAAGNGETGFRPLERRAEKAALRHGGMGEAGTWGVPVMGDAVNLNGPVVAGAASVTPEMSVAEQVSYWVSRGTQNAELELDGLGEGPVKVSISLHGQEARVDFRADQIQTRQMLEGSVSHLRELLQREGLVLSGVSIGSSGSEGAAGRQPQSRQGGRQTSVALAELPSTVAGQGARSTSLTGRSVDLFV